MRKYSTGALTDEQKAVQDQRYAEGHAYDYLIVGSGVSALTVGALLAHAGFRICMLEAHDVPGGYAHTFEMNGFHFCAQVHYIWGCAPGQRIYEFLRHIGLEEEIRFQSFDPEGYDRVTLPDGRRVGIPYGFDRLVDQIEIAYPGQRKSLEHFFKIFSAISAEMNQFPVGKMAWWRYLVQGYRFLNLLKYKNRTLQDLFDECGLSKEVQAILSANSGDFMAPPEELSVFPYIALFSGYNTGAYYPEKHYRFFIERLARFIAEKPGCHIYYETEVTDFERGGGRIEAALTADGRRFTAEKILCNMDPQKASYLIGRNHFTKPFLDALSYDYAPSSFNIYLGIKDLNLREFGFGNYNIWHLEQWDMNRTWKEILSNDYSRPLVFLSTPTLHTDWPGELPEGCDILEIVTACNYGHFAGLKPAEYRHLKREVATRLIDLVEARYIPNLRKHIQLKVVGTPTTNEDFCFSPFGNAYGSHMRPQNMGLSRLKAPTPWPNFFWCNASSGYPGVYGTVVTGMDLYMDLTGDRFFPIKDALLDEEAIRYAKERVAGAGVK